MRECLEISGVMWQSQSNKPRAAAGDTGWGLSYQMAEVVLQLQGSPAIASLCQRLARLRFPGTQHLSLKETTLAPGLSWPLRLLLCTLFLLRVCN